jgi:hypothetical protein
MGSPIRVFTDNHCQAVRLALRPINTAGERPCAKTFEHCDIEYAPVPSLQVGFSRSAIRHAFGSKTQVDEVRHLIGTASAWGGNPDQDAIYLNVTPAKNDGQTVPAHRDGGSRRCLLVDHRLQCGRVYSGKPSQRLQLEQHYRTKGRGRLDCGAVWKLSWWIANCLPITPGWNYLVSALSTACRDPERYMGLPQCSAYAGGLTSTPIKAWNEKLLDHFICAGKQGPIGA